VPDGEGGEDAEGDRFPGEDAEAVCDRLRGYRCAVSIQLVAARIGCCEAVPVQFFV
jgi:hypothetical protein